jgi:hypothetical protein
MKRSLLALCVAGGLVATLNCATKPETKVIAEGNETVIKQTGPGENVKTTIVTGVVTKYEPGNELEIRPADGNMHDFVLEDSVQVQGAIVIGQPVTVTYTDVGGKKHATIISTEATPPQ